MMYVVLVIVGLILGLITGALIATVSILEHYIKNRGHSTSTRLNSNKLRSVRIGSIWGLESD